MEIREQRDGGVATITLTGRLTVNDQPGVLKDAVTGALRRGARNVLLDLSGVPYIDSTRLGELIGAHVTVSRQGGQLRLVATPPRIMELLQLAGLGGVFVHYDSAAAARADLDTGPQG
ncbi:MAG: STAS domain-containing protein [Vicinamibacterales bacterium]